MKKLILLLPLLLFGCSDDNPTNSASSFKGNWNAAFTGDATGSGTIVINNDGSFSSVITFPSFTNTISGKVLSTGAVSEGKIFYNGAEIGSITGSFSTATGSGQWVTSVPTSGVWSASK